MSETILYDGEVKLDFNETRHIYKVNGETVNGVTTILSVIAKPALIYWAANMASEYVQANIKPGIALNEIEIAALVKGAKGAHREKKETAADIGTLCHAFAEQYLKGQNPDLPVHSQAKAACEQFLGWMAEHHVKVLHSERKIYSRRHQYAGTVDFIGEVDGVPALGDWKSSNAVYPEMFLQDAAYDLAFKEETGWKSQRRFIARFPKDGGTFEVAYATDHTADETAFLNAMYLYRWQKKVSK